MANAQANILLVVPYGHYNSDDFSRSSAQSCIRERLKSSLLNLFLRQLEPPLVVFRPSGDYLRVRHLPPKERPQKSCLYDVKLDENII